MQLGQPFRQYCYIFPLAIGGHFIQSVEMVWLVLVGGNKENNCENFLEIGKPKRKRCQFEFKSSSSAYLLQKNFAYLKPFLKPWT